MTGIAEKANPKLWERVKTAVTRDSKGGKPGQWSARKAQLATQSYKKKGGGYTGGKTADNHLAQWTGEEWNTKSGAPSGQTHERYLPKKAREHLSDADYRRTTAKKRADTAKGKQFSPQPKDIATRTAKDRDTGHETSRANLLRQAARKGVAGRSKMTTAELRKLLHAHGGHSS